MDEQKQFMKRAISLARLGAGFTRSNPMVGAVLVHGGRIIGEGYHRKFGEAHAEVDCLNQVATEDQHLVSESTMYVTLEPCSHYGKTPPCADLIIKRRIPRVVIGTRDPFPAVNGKGIEKLQSAGIDVQIGLLGDECSELNKRFFTFHTKQRPYLILKWAQTADHFISGHGKDRLMISNQYTNRLVHKWRSEEMAIMIGTNTALTDDPSLTNRLWSGNSPLRIVIDNSLKLPRTLKIFNDGQPTIVINLVKDEDVGNLKYLKTTTRDLLQSFHALQVNSVIIEGGSRLLNFFIESGNWDEARVITNESLFVGSGLPAPNLRGGKLYNTQRFDSDVINYFSKDV